MKGGSAQCAKAHAAGARRSESDVSALVHAVAHMGRRLAVAALLALLFACGVKAPPQPPGAPAARKGEPVAPCPGCRIPAPDSLPAPSSPGEGRDVVPEDEESEEPEPEEGTEGGRGRGTTPP